MSKTLIAPSILSADFGAMRSYMQTLEKAGADWLHMDVMDGAFVPPITFGDNLVKVASSATKLFIDTHLMVENPERHVEAFAKAGTKSLTFHLEATKDPLKVIELMRAHNLKVGLALKIETPVAAAYPLLEKIDMLLLMSIIPGWAGTAFMPEVLPRIKQARAEINRCGLPVKIEVDGGINPTTAKQCTEAGVDVLVAASYISSASDMAAAIKSLRF